MFGPAGVVWVSAQRTNHKIVRDKLHNSASFCQRIRAAVRSHRAILLGYLAVWPIVAFFHWSGGFAARSGRPPPNISFYEALAHSFVLLVVALVLGLLFRPRS